ncbi:acyl-CoA dehydrogenase family protein [Dactylosporangium salmoneum]|uniref:Acyl-CoA dehydrogenase n=1 Tax=Dactylosporangium salmoneum TaxID=53361 RepID=A0ABN3GQH0_9ACTN
MFLEYTDEQHQLRRELRAYFARLLTPEVREAIGGMNEDRPAYREVVRQMGRDGWLGLGWPTEYGGQGRPAVDQYILFDEVQRAGAPFPFVTINNIGPTIQRFGTEEQKRTYLPGMLTGDVLFAIGYTEPDSGTDLASLKTRAVLDGDDWVINGNKVFTSGASQADYIWLACRTDPAEPRHHGISIVIVSTSDPGFSSTPIATSGLTHTNVTYYSDVRAPRENLVGELHGGWKLINSQLGHERVGLAAFGGRTEQLWEDVADWCRQDQGAGRPVDQPWVRHDLARTYVEIEAMRLLNWKLAVLGEAQSPDPASAAVAKVFGTETHDRVCRTLLGAVGPLATRRPGSAGAPLDGRLEALTRGSYINTFGGGTNEVLRDVIATRGLGMPRKGR